MDYIYATLDMSKLAQMTPTAIQLYELVARHKAGLTISLDEYQRICGVESESAKAWELEVERVCRELVSNGVVRAAWVDAGHIHFK